MKYPNDVTTAGQKLIEYWHTCRPTYLRLPLLAALCWIISAAHYGRLVNDNLSCTCRQQPEGLLSPIPSILPVIYWMYMDDVRANRLTYTSCSDVRMTWLPCQAVNKTKYEVAYLWMTTWPDPCTRANEFFWARSWWAVNDISYWLELCRKCANVFELRWAVH